MTTRPTFDEWLVAARSYARTIYDWTDFTRHETRSAYADGLTAEAFVDQLAATFGLNKRIS
ncbi:MAG TPA: hypothetical protein P5256_09615 [Beijerinckiaceae bacterium]|nr:hypothetical protein [Hyphomicrobiales bacterium]HRY03375.1 hypothetical protein [Beijerinckiaceae bacterium]